MEKDADKDKDIFGVEQLELTQGQIDNATIILHNVLTEYLRTRQ